ncbi:NAD(P)-dependent oxidoreductase [Micromonospora sp. RTGN7]|uniref:NAD(P)-dependent oxidoreductase n=1 Tax=Micromonospora sp. RTGN7 TaxID=3016526 RepID=UPI0029FF530A|nr:NAD(P)-dependent oxidoreductase [Micromonospora sp. RTGN7]
MQSRIAFLGLGRMGLPMAVRLAQAGHDVTVWNRTGGRDEPARAAGAQAATSAQEAVQGRRVVITMLSDPDAVLTVLGELTLEPGTTVVEMSTIGPDAVTLLRERLPEHVALVDAPVLGSVPQAEAGKLHIFAGGSAPDIAHCAPVLSVLGHVEHTGELGDGAAVKLVVNVATINAIVLLGEALGLAERLGVGRDVAFDALTRTTLAPLIGVMRPRVGVAEQPALFALGLAEKDLRLALAAGATADGVIGAAQRSLAQGLDAGLGGNDISAIIRRLADGATVHGH